MALASSLLPADSSTPRSGRRDRTLELPHRNGLGAGDCRNLSRQPCAAQAFRRDPSHRCSPQGDPGNGPGGGYCSRDPGRHRDRCRIRSSRRDEARERAVSGLERADGRLCLRLSIALGHKTVVLVAGRLGTSPLRCMAVGAVSQTRFAHSLGHAIQAVTAACRVTACTPLIGVPPLTTVVLARRRATALTDAVLLCLPQRSSRTIAT